MTNEGSWSLKKPKKHGKSTGNELFNAEECRVEQPDEHKSHGKFFLKIFRPKSSSTRSNNIETVKH